MQRKKSQMKTILVATDFSDASMSAAKYAKSLATAFNARMILFNAYQALPGYAEALVTLASEDLKEYAIQNLTDQARSLDIHGLPYCYTALEEGDAAEAIIRKVKKEKVDVIIIGMKLEHKNFRKVFGSTISSLCMHSPVPLLIIPESAEFCEIKNIALAFKDDAMEHVNPRLLDVFREIAERFHSSVYVVKVFGDELKDERKFHHRPNRLIKMIRTTDPVFDTVDGNDVAEELLQYIENRDLDVLATMPDRLMWFEKIFAKSITKQLVFSTHIPLLIIPQTKS
jgi:nucleotide-binding universal stress UspA family protein